MKSCEKNNKNSLDTTWTKLESSLLSFTPREIIRKKPRPSTGRINRHRNISQEVPLCETIRNSRRNLSSSSFAQSSSGKTSQHFRSVSCPTAVFIPELTPAEIKFLYTAKCYDLGIQPFSEQEKRFNSYCLHHFYHRNFDMIESGLGFESAKAIGSVLQTSNHFSFIRLGKNNLGDKGCVEIMKSIYKNLSISHVDFSSNELSCNGVKDMTEYFCRNESLISIDISSHKGLNRNRIGWKGAESIGKVLQTNKILQFLNLAGTGIGAEGLKYLIPGIESSQNLLNLNLSSNGLGWEKIQELGRSVLSSKIIKLEIANNKLGYEGALAIAEMLMGHDNKACTVESLDLSMNLITTKGLSKILYSLTNNNTLRFLDLSENDFSAGLSTNFPIFLIENSGVEFLNMSKCEIKSASLIGAFPESFPKNRFLTELNLSKNKIDDVGAEAICMGLSRNLGLKKLDLSGNYIKERGGKAFAVCLKINHTLEELNLKENNINDLAGQHLDDICRKNRNITEINLDLNSVALSFVFNIKHNLKKNKEQKKRKLIPELKGKINYLSQNSEKLGKVTVDLEKRQSEFSEIFKRVEKNSERLAAIRAEEEKKNQVVHDEYLLIKEKNELVSREFEQLIFEMTVNEK